MRLIVLMAVAAAIVSVPTAATLAKRASPSWSVQPTDISAAKKKARKKAPKVEYMRAVPSK